MSAFGVRCSVFGVRCYEAFYHPDHKGSRIPRSVAAGANRMHGTFRPTRVLAAAPLTARHSHKTRNLKRRGTVPPPQTTARQAFGASRLWHTKNVALVLRSQTPLGATTRNATPLRPLSLPIINPDHAIHHVGVAKMWTLGSPRDVEAPGDN